MPASIARRTLAETVVPFTAGDGLGCNLIHVTGPAPATRGPVLLVHGAGVRAHVFQPPTERTIVEALVDEGYDVWLENWRASVDLPPTKWTLDQAARHDHPAAVQTVVRETGARSLKAIVHCQGSTSFMMSAVAGLVPEVTTIISNAVSLHPVIPGLAAFKLLYALPPFGLISDYMNPQWGLRAPTIPAKLIKAIVALTHHECRNAVCKQVSFTYGGGFPSLWSHENLNGDTHAWISGEFGPCSVAFFRQMGRCVRRGHLVSVDRALGLPEDFVAEPPKTTARVSFVAGARNLCFLPQSQVNTFEYFRACHPDRGHTLHVLPNYGHLDVFIGRDAAQDVFPVILNELAT
jgi:pimeloyl-ACP methyl ester carboxylesterase